LLNLLVCVNKKHYILSEADSTGMLEMQPVSVGATYTLLSVYTVFLTVIEPFLAPSSGITPLIWSSNLKPHSAIRVAHNWAYAI
jgi:hypothetical protein